MSDNTPPVFRFAPSPNGALHLGHAYSALVNYRLAQEVGGKFLLRIEDIDRVRCRSELEKDMLEDLEWLGLEWESTPRRQSDHFANYAEALDTLVCENLIYPSFMTRGQIRDRVAQLREGGKEWKNDPDGSPLYPGSERDWPIEELEKERINSPLHTLRLNMQKALEFACKQIKFHETGSGPQNETGNCTANPKQWGDLVLARSDTPTSYHLSVVIDDALQGVTHVVRGRDLFHATSVHRLLQELLGLPEPEYHHHDLILADDGRKLSKSAGDTSLRALRNAGFTADDVKRLIGFST